MTLADPVSPDLKRHLRTLKLGQLLATLPDRLTLARQQKLPHADFLELLLSDEVTRRENGSAARRARAAGLDPDMRLDTWDTTAAVRYDQQLWNELVSLRFAEAAHGALILGPVGVGKTHLATALGHIAVRRRLTVHMARAGHLFKRLKAARLDNSTEAEHRRLAAVNLLIIDDFALQPLDETATTDFYELTVARHRNNATIVTSNRTPDEWLGLMHDQLLAQSAVDRLTSTCHELVIEGDSYRKRQRPTPPLSLTDPAAHPKMTQQPQGWSLGRGNTLVPCSWQMTCLLTRRVCRQCSRPGYIPCDLVGRYSLVRVISLSCALLYGQIQASADQDHRLIPRCNPRPGWVGSGPDGVLGVMFRAALRTGSEGFRLLDDCHARLEIGLGCGATRAAAHTGGGAVNRHHALSGQLPWYAPGVAAVSTGSLVLLSWPWKVHDLILCAPQRVVMVLRWPRRYAACGSVCRACEPRRGSRR